MYTNVYRTHFHFMLNHNNNITCGFYLCLVFFYLAGLMWSLVCVIHLPFNIWRNSFGRSRVLINFNKDQDKSQWRAQFFFSLNVCHNHSSRPIQITFLSSYSWRIENQTTKHIVNGLCNAFFRFSYFMAWVFSIQVFLQSCCVCVFFFSNENCIGEVSSYMPLKY